MTLPNEEARAVLETRRFLFDLLNPKETPRVPRAIRLRARALVKHYPYLYRAVTDRIVNVDTGRQRFSKW